MPSPKRALAYIRVSVVGDRAARGRFESPALQRDAIDYKARELGVTIVREFQDLNRSGGHMSRPGILAAVEMLRAGEADGIIVARSDRASRRVLDGLKLIEDLEKAGLWLLAADGTIDTTSRFGRMATTMTLAQAQNELERYREMSEVVHKRAILEKGRHMGPAPFGYVRDPQTMRLVPDPERAEFARRVFEARAVGTGWVEIAARLEEQGVRHPSGNILNQQALRRMVKRRVYLGEASHGDTVKAGAHPALVDEGLWQAANRSSTHVGSKPATPRTWDESPLRGLLRCAGCRYVMKRLPSPSGARWVCRTVTTERAVTHECGHPARLSPAEARQTLDVVVAEFMRLAAGVESRADDAQALDEARRVEADAEALLDELSSLQARRDLGQARWSRMVAEARSDAERAREARVREERRASTGAVDSETLEQAWPLLTDEERAKALRSIVKAVMVGERPALVADRVWVVPQWVDVDLPRRGIQGFDARPWVPGDV